MLSGADAAMPPDADAAMLRVAALNGAYAAALDSGRFEDWPGFFLDRCLYKVTTADNHEKGYQAGLIYADSQAMLVDRIAALRQANIYEKQRYRHVLGLPLIADEADGEISAETSFLVVRTMRDGQMMIFAAGIYRDRLRPDATGSLRYAERVVVCDSQRFDTLLAIPL
ncbi:aromatic-ring-hydroxylating dioxygenase subunit beta [Rhodopila sp.]|uniref:aromatic-ring-hydroxylating dioxygenase subunit beta n=1 Tax=Rhodopila sp. TaxID=2480087 RepID=UPI003D14F959